MKAQRFFPYIPILIPVIVGLICVSSFNAKAQNKQRIGTFDSRAVAIVYCNSKYFKSSMEPLMAQMKTAKEKDDKKTIAKCEREGSLRQTMMHEQGFGTGSISGIIETVKDKIAVLAKNENLTAIVSKWELTYNSPDVELIDVTEKIAAFFEPNDRMKEMIKEVLKSEPIKDAYLIED